MAGGRDALHTGRLSQPRREGLDGLQTGGIKKVDFYSAEEYNLISVQYYPLDTMHFAHKAFATASIDLDHLALLSCRLGYFFSQLCASPWMVCGLIDFDFSDNQPHGRPSRLALDPLFFVPALAEPLPLTLRVNLALCCMVWH